MRGFKFSPSDESKVSCRKIEVNIVLGYRLEYFRRSQKVARILLGEVFSLMSIIKKIKNVYISGAKY